MKRILGLASTGLLWLAAPFIAVAGNVRTDFDHGANFSKYHTYSWGKVQTTDPFYVTRIQDAVDGQLQAKGWQRVPSDGSVVIFATDNIHNQKQLQTTYDGFGGGWGGGWGWRRWGWGGLANPGGFVDATTTSSNQSVGNVVIDLFEGSSKNILWRGLATEDLLSNADKNTKELDGDIKRMFKEFPPKTSNK